MCGRPKGFMNAIRLKSPRLRLDSESYRELHRQVLERDGWRCQFCGSMQNLQVHHLKFRSQSGGDVEQNLITLCAECHAGMHSKRYPIVHVK
jgi:5-methylcytosine-specific restriction endonuclease McrA